MMDEALDVYTYDSYPNFAYCLEEDPIRDYRNPPEHQSLPDIRRLPGPSSFGLSG